MISLRRAKHLRLLLLLLAATLVAHAAAPPDHWVGTWAASPVAAVNEGAKLIPGDVTLREIVHVSIGGPLVRVVISNEFGTDPLDHRRRTHRAQPQRQ